MINSSRIAQSYYWWMCTSLFVHTVMFYEYSKFILTCVRYLATLFRLTDDGVYAKLVYMFEQLVHVFVTEESCGHTILLLSL